MKKLPALLMVGAAFSLLPSISQALCVASGEVTRVVTLPAAGLSNVWVRFSVPAATTFSYFTNDAKMVTAALSAQASHMRVTAVGSAATCGAPSGGLSAGGTLTQLITAP